MKKLHFERFATGLKSMFGHYLEVYINPTKYELNDLLKLDVDYPHYLRALVYKKDIYMWSGDLEIHKNVYNELPELKGKDAMRIVIDFDKKFLEYDSNISTQKIPDKEAVEILKNNHLSTLININEYKILF